MSNGTGTHGRHRLPRPQRTGSLCEAELGLVTRPPLTVISSEGGNSGLIQIQDICARLPLARVPSDHSTEATEPEVQKPQRRTSKHHRTPSMCFESGTTDQPSRGKHSHVISEVPGSRGDFQMPPELLETYETVQPQTVPLELIVEAVDFSDPRHSQVCTPSSSKAKSIAKSRNSSKNSDTSEGFQASGIAYCPKCRRRVNTETGSHRPEEGGKGKPKEPRRLRVIRCALCLYVISKLN